MSARATFVSMLAVAMMACVERLPGDDAMDGTDDEAEWTTYGDESTDGADATDETGEEGVNGWSDIRCVDIGAADPLCLGMIGGTDEAWAFVVQVCDLEQAITDGLGVEVQTWGATTCADGLAPSADGWDDVRCFDSATIGTVCYGIRGEWATALLPPCMIEQGDVTPWPASVCPGETAELVTHPFDDAWCIDAAEGSCFAEIGGGLLHIQPTCWIDMRTPAELPECAWPDGDPWSPCPTDSTTGLPTLCDEGVACVPSENGNMCLPVGECPAMLGFGASQSMGWGDVCYPRCEFDDDCAPGMICDVSLNDEPMCSWPL